MGQDTGERFFLVVVDDTEELHQALYFACGRANSTGGRIAMVYVIPPAEFAHWAGVGELMRQEAREKAEESIAREAKHVEELTGKAPLVFIREGKPVDEIISLMTEGPNIACLFLALTQELIQQARLSLFNRQRGFKLSSAYHHCPWQFN